MFPTPHLHRLKFAQVLLSNTNDAGPADLIALFQHEPFTRCQTFPRNLQSVRIRLGELLRTAKHVEDELAIVPPLLIADMENGVLDGKEMQSGASIDEWLCIHDVVELSQKELGRSGLVGVQMKNKNVAIPATNILEFIHDDARARIFDQCGEVLHMVRALQIMVNGVSTI